jgi:hypothetical protein
MTNELLNPYCFTHLVVRNVQFQGLVVLRIKILDFFDNNEISCHH